jgi:hypothetical protein
MEGPSPWVALCVAATAAATAAETARAAAAAAAAMARMAAAAAAVAAGVVEGGVEEMDVDDEDDGRTDDGRADDDGDDGDGFVDQAGLEEEVIAGALDDIVGAADDPPVYTDFADFIMPIDMSNPATANAAASAAAAVIGIFSSGKVFIEGGGAVEAKATAFAYLSLVAGDQSVVGPSAVKVQLEMYPPTTPMASRRSLRSRTSSCTSPTRAGTSPWSRIILRRTTSSATSRSRGRTARRRGLTLVHTFSDTGPEPVEMCWAWAGHLPPAA